MCSVHVAMIMCIAPRISTLLQRHFYTQTHLSRKRFMMILNISMFANFKILFLHVHCSGVDGFFVPAKVKIFLSSIVPCGLLLLHAFNSIAGMAQWWEHSTPTNVARVWSRTWRHMSVEFVVGSRPCSERFSPGTPVSPSPKKPTLNSNSIWKVSPISAPR